MPFIRRYSTVLKNPRGKHRFLDSLNPDVFSRLSSTQHCYQVHPTHLSHSEPVPTKHELISEWGGTRTPIRARRHDVRHSTRCSFLREPSHWQVFRSVNDHLSSITTIVPGPQDIMLHSASRTACASFGLRVRR